MFLDSNGKRLFKKEKSIHEFAEEPEIKELIKLGFMQIDNSKYEYNENCYCKKCKEQRENK
jgi:beta-galactosidase GanA